MCTGMCLQWMGFTKNKRHMFDFVWWRYQSGSWRMWWWEHKWSWRMFIHMYVGTLQCQLSVRWMGPALGNIKQFLHNCMWWRIKERNLRMRWWKFFRTWWLFSYLYNLTMSHKLFMWRLVSTLVNWNEQMWNCMWRWVYSRSLEMRWWKFDWWRRMRQIMYFRDSSFDDCKNVKISLLDIIRNGFQNCRTRGFECFTKFPANLWCYKNLHVQNLF